MSRIVLLCLPSEKPAETLYSCIEDLWRKAGRAKHIVSDEERRTAFLCYTSGTTGQRKAVELSQHNMTSQIQALRKIFQPLRYTDAVLGCLPFSHFHGLMCLVHLPLTVHATVVVLPKFDEISVLKTIEKVSSDLRGRLLTSSVQNHDGSC